MSHNLPLIMLFATFRVQKTASISLVWHKTNLAATTFSKRIIFQEPIIFNLENESELELSVSSIFKTKKKKRKFLSQTFRISLKMAFELLNFEHFLRSAIIFVSD